MEHLGVLKNSLKRVHAFQIELEFGSAGFQGKVKTVLPSEKPFGARKRTNNKLNPHNGVDARIRTWATLVGGECSHHCATFASPYLPVMSPHANGTRHLSH